MCWRNLEHISFGQLSGQVQISFNIIAGNFLNELLFASLKNGGLGIGTIQSIEKLKYGQENSRCLFKMKIHNTHT